MQDWSLDDHEYLYTLSAKTKSLFKLKRNEIYNHSLSFLTCLFGTNVLEITRKLLTVSVTNQNSEKSKKLKI